MSDASLVSPSTPLAADLTHRPLNLYIEQSSRI